MPLRDAYSERTYALDQVEKLCVIKPVLDNGHRPGRIVAMNIEGVTAVATLQDIAAEVAK